MALIRFQNNLYFLDLFHQGTTYSCTEDHPADAELFREDGQTDGRDEANILSEA